MKSSSFSLQRLLNVILLMAFFISESAIAQQSKPILERTVTLKVRSMRTDAVMNMISTQAHFSFSYNPDFVDESRLVTGTYVKKPVREVLNSILDENIIYKEKNGYLILQKSKKKIQKQDPKDYISFIGYIRDEKDEFISWASIYDKVSLESTVSNDYGYYKIRFYLKQLPLTLYISKLGYVDTTLYIDSNSQLFNIITLRKQPPVIPPVPQTDSSSVKAEKTADSFFGNLESDVNATNITDTIYRKVQGSLLPYIGSNGQLCGNVINEYSFNVFGGYSLGVKKLELAGLFNLTRGDMEFAQLAGFVNLNGGNVRGLQMAGFTNLVRGETEAAQFAGFVNVGWNKFEGAQFAGFVNTVKGTTTGIQAAGFVNTSLDTVKGVQLAGFCNVANKSIEGAQIAGFCNVTVDTVKGAQIGFVNYAKHINGSQIGFLNISLSTTGVPVGFLSYVHNGYHKFEISADELFPVNASLRSGVRPFHNILTAGMKPGTGDSIVWNFGYGLGSSVKLSPKTLLDFDLTSSQIVQDSTLEKINLLNKFYLGIDTRIAKGFSLAFGVTVNGQLTKTDYNSYPDVFTYYTPHIFYTNTWEQEKVQLQMWFGGKIALRFF